MPVPGPCPLEVRLLIRVRDRVTQQRSHCFLNVNDDLGGAQLLGQTLVFTSQLLVFQNQRVVLGLGATLMRAEGVLDASFAFLPPGREQGQ